MAISPIEFRPEQDQKDYVRNSGLTITRSVYGEEIEEMLGHLAHVFRNRRDEIDVRSLQSPRKQWIPGVRILRGAVLKDKFANSNVETDTLLEKVLTESPSLMKPVEGVSISGAECHNIERGTHRFISLELDPEADSPLFKEFGSVRKTVERLSVGYDNDEFCGWPDEYPEVTIMYIDRRAPSRLAQFALKYVESILPATTDLAAQDNYRGEKPPR